MEKILGRKKDWFRKRPTVAFQRHLEQLARDRVDEIPRHGNPVAGPTQREIAGLEGKPMERGSARVGAFEALVHDLRVEVCEDGGGGPDGEVGRSVEPVDVPVIF